MREPIRRKTSSLIRTAAGVWLAVLAVAIPRGTAAQRHAIVDSSLSSSLLTSALSIPMARSYATSDSVFARRFSRVEVQHSRTSTTGVAPTVILGFRSEDVRLDSLAWNASTIGIRTAFARTASGDDDIKLSALELYLGGRTLGHMEGGLANIGAELVAGWSRLDANTRASLALRFPIEFIKARGQTSVAFSLVPTMAWGHPRWRSCEDRGSGDGCSPNGQFAVGRTRFIVGSGVTLSLPPGLSLTAGVQHMFARTQQPRFALALGLGG